MKNLETVILVLIAVFIFLMAQTIVIAIDEIDLTEPAVYDTIEDSPCGG